jgi:glutamate-ammonia-ligase adenylyltransferase
VAPISRCCSSIRRRCAGRAPDRARRAGRHGYLQRHPILLDELLDARLLDRARLAGLPRQLSRAELDELSPIPNARWTPCASSHHAQVFRLLAQDLAGLLTVEKLADHLSELADIVLAACARPGPGSKLPEVIATCETPRFAVISYGKLGGKELGYASDLDLVFLFDDAHPDAGEIYSPGWARG